MLVKSPPPLSRGTPTSCTCQTCQRYEHHPLLSLLWRLTRSSVIVCLPIFSMTCSGWHFDAWHPPQNLLHHDIGHLLDNFSMRPRSFWHCSSFKTLHLRNWHNLKREIRTVLSSSKTTTTIFSVRLLTRGHTMRAKQLLAQNSNTRILHRGSGSTRCSTSSR